MSRFVKYVSYFHDIAVAVVCNDSFYKISSETESDVERRYHYFVLSHSPSRNKSTVDRWLDASNSSTSQMRQ